MPYISQYSLPIISRLVFVLAFITNVSPLLIGVANAEIVSKGYPYNPYVPLELWQNLEPYFFPRKNPAYPLMDKMFSAERITLSAETLRKAGFQHVKERRYKYSIILGKHKKFPKHLFKFYVDTQEFDNEWGRYMDRIYGAEAIRECISNHHFEKNFKVPRKWLFPLPVEPSPPDDPRYFRKHFVLVVEDMHLLKPHANYEAYRQQMTKEKLDALYTILTEVGLDDSTYAHNTVFCEDGKIAFIDTEKYHQNSVPYVFLLQYLSKPMQNYWQQLMDQGGPKNLAK